MSKSIQYWYFVGGDTRSGGADAVRGRRRMSRLSPAPCPPPLGLANAKGDRSDTTQLIQEFSQSACDFGGLLQFALPHNRRPPATSFKQRNIGFVPGVVTHNFLPPIFGVASRPPASASAIMTMPEAPMNKNNLTPAREYEIRPSGKILAVQAKAITQAMCDATNCKFRPRVPTLHCPHYPTALFRAFLHRRSSIFRLGSVSNSSTISL
jgi:hypothetical protein